MGKTIHLKKRGATSALTYAQVLAILQANGFRPEIDEDDELPSATARTAARAVQNKLGSDVAVSRSGQSITLWGPHAKTGGEVSVFLRIANATGKKPGRVSDDLLRTITKVTGIVFDSHPAQ